MVEVGILKAVFYGSGYRPHEPESSMDLVVKGHDRVKRKSLRRLIVLDLEL